MRTSHPLRLKATRKVARLAREAILVAYRPIHRRHQFLATHQIVFILGHMRSGSSMLTKVLCSHPEICGAGELHRAYDTDRKLEDLAIWLHWIDAAKLKKSRFLLDKILHGRLLPDPSILVKSRAKCVFLLREPESSIKSMVTRLRRTEMFGRPEVATEYYTSRLAQLMDFASRLEAQNAIMLDYQEITSRTTETLERLRAFLNLSVELSPQYDVDEATARWARGDGSEHILKGVIHSAKTNYGDLSIPPKLLNQAVHAYERASSFLRDRVQNLDDSEPTQPNLV